MIGHEYIGMDREAVTLGGINKDFLKKQTVFIVGEK
jgi:hypothetical protein